MASVTVSHAVLGFKEPLIYIIMAPKHKSSDASNSDTPKRSQSASFKWKGESSLLHKKKNCMLMLLRSMIRMNLQSLKVCKRKKEIRASSAVSPQTAKVMATVGDKCFCSDAKGITSLK